MKPVDSFRAVLDTARSELKKFDFKRAGASFSRHSPGAWSIIDFQKSRTSSSSNIVFTLNLGVFVESIRKFEGADVPVKPKIEQCHWRMRIGNAMPQHEDLWWSLDGGTADQVVSDSVLAALQSYGLPILSKFSNLQALCEAWQRGESPGLTDVQRLMNLSVLLATLNLDEELESVLTQLNEVSKDSPVSAALRFHMEKLKRWRQG